MTQLASKAKHNQIMQKMQIIHKQNTKINNKDHNNNQNQMQFPQIKEMLSKYDYIQYINVNSKCKSF
jgi:hypothetical protein